MTARAALFTLISADSTLNGLGIDANSTFPANSVDNPEVRPFVVIRFDAKTAMFADRGSQNLVIWAHDDRGDYSRIDSILERIREVLDNAVHVSGADGIILTSARYIGSSTDLWDDGYRTMTRNSTFSVSSRES